jgi:hypothetical protein
VRVNHATATNYKAEKGYGRWLTFLQIVVPGCLMEPPAQPTSPSSRSRAIMVAVLLPRQIRLST